jgi:phage repressor protein C with HTH and peptisase S24 domain
MGNFKLLSERLKWAVQRRLEAEPTITRITKGKIALEAGVSPTAAGYWFADTNGMQAPAARRLGAFLGVDPVWLEKGEGSPEIAPAKEDLGYQALEASDQQFVQIPLVELKLSAGLSGYQTAPLGEGDSILNLRQGWMRSRRLNPKNLVAIQVTGDSMERALHAGDIVILDTSDTSPKDGEVYAVNYEGQAVVKRLERDAGDWWLTSDNASPGRHARKVCRGDDCIIVGRVVRKESDRI